MVENTFQRINLLGNGLIAVEKKHKDFLFVFGVMEIKQRFYSDGDKMWFAVIKHKN